MTVSFSRRTLLHGVSYPLSGLGEGTEGRADMTPHIMQTSHKKWGILWEPLWFLMSTVNMSLPILRTRIC